ncbi:hypothetical protein JRQ81_012291 [Phrynocephalus forsythii]|uniref:Uncharacterized protein n=1 Tax=Phrynocephalus forsythii TaxID=171643 RepID=A0A9Q0X5N9_9SAUR|nr:hypothetical protein JRQ81_012291 [Phrynocephalus forsythii]
MAMAPTSSLLDAQTLPATQEDNWVQQFAEQDALAREMPLSPVMSTGLPPGQMVLDMDMTTLGSNPLAHLQSMHTASMPLAPPRYHAAEESTAPRRQTAEHRSIVPKGRPQTSAKTEGRDSTSSMSPSPHRRRSKHRHAKRRRRRGSSSSTTLPRRHKGKHPNKSRRQFQVVSCSSDSDSSITGSSSSTPRAKRHRRECKCSETCPLVPSGNMQSQWIQIASPFLLQWIFLQIQLLPLLHKHDFLTPLHPWIVL